jgi:hypothetical protein
MTKQLGHGGGECSHAIPPPSAKLALVSQHENIVQHLVVLLHKIISQRTEDKAMRQPWPSCDARGH